jgi:hypothetical protein
VTTYYVNQRGPAGNGTSETDTSRTIPSYTNNDTILFKGSEVFSTGSQINITATGTTWGSYGTGRAIITSTATSFGSVNVQNAGTTYFQDLYFREFLNGSANGAVINCAVSGSRASNLDVRRCRFERTIYSAIRINGTDTASAASTFVCLDSEFEDIGEDCVFGAALNYRFGRNKCTNISSRTSTGDGVGFINADPDFVWIHDNYIDHSNVDDKQCVVVDSSTGVGSVLIENNTFIGYGSRSDFASTHTVVLTDCLTIARGNKFVCGGYALSLPVAGSKAIGNVFEIVNSNPSNPIVAMQAAVVVDNNTFIAKQTLAATQAIVVQAAALTGCSVRNNIFVDVPIAIKSDSVGNNPTATNNCFSGVTTARRAQDGSAFSGGNDVSADPALSGYTPTNTSLSTGLALGNLDFYGRTVSYIGAVQPQTARSVVSRTVASRSVATRATVRR